MRMQLRKRKVTDRPPLSPSATILATAKHFTGGLLIHASNRCTVQGRFSLLFCN